MVGRIRRGVQLKSGRVVGKGENAHWVEHIEKLDVTGMEDRKELVCKRCGWSTYPECKKECKCLGKKVKYD